PAAAACIIGALTLFSGPTGIASIGALLVAIGPLRTIVSKRAKRFGYAALLAPILAAGLVTLIVIFRDQTLVGEIQANALKSAVGPSLNWFDEHVRYERLFLPTTDGAISRRFPVLALVIALGVAVAMTLRKNKIPGTASGPSRRIIGITLISFVAIMFTPTKWTHHFGVFAGLAGSLGALAAVAVTAAAMRSPRNRTLYAAIVLFVLSLSFSSVNGWWYVSNFGVPWSNSFPQWHFGISTVFFGLSVLAILIAAWMHFTGRDHPGRTPVHPVLARLAESPLAVGTWIVVVWSIFSLTAGMINQYPAWSVGRSNLDALRGNGCGLANDVMVEEDPNAGML
ncbi:arabinosyltransferase domain-containing protein, partial [Mycobacteroides abscessus]